MKKLKKAQKTERALTVVVRNTSYALTLVSCVFVMVKMMKSEPCITGFSNRGTAPVIQFEKVDPGYTLIAPLYGTRQSDHLRSVYLVDMWGKNVHQWKTRGLVYSAILRDQGNLLVGIVNPHPFAKFARSSFESIQEISWNGKVVWEYPDRFLHHDFDVLPNGNIGSLRYEKVPRKIASQIKGGRAGSEFEGDVWGDVITEISPDKKVVWEWKPFHYLDPTKYPIAREKLRSEWTHANALRYLVHNPIDGEPAYLMSFRELHKILMIRRKDGAVIWESPDGLLHGQHDPTLLENGNLLVFNNGEESTEILEINPRSNRVVWRYSAGDSAVEKMQFFSVNQGSAQRLRNGNTLVSESTSGHLFEIDPLGEVVWDLIVPFGAPGVRGPWLHNDVFRARRYFSGDVQWPEKLGSPLPRFPLWCQTLMMEKSRRYFDR